MSNKNTDSKTDSKTEALLAIDQNKVSAPVLKAALAQLQKENDERAQKTALSQLRNVEVCIQGLVTQIRQVRASEKALLAQLKVVNDAKEKFLQDGNYVEFVKKFKSAVAPNAMVLHDIGARGATENYDIGPCGMTAVDKSNLIKFLMI